MELVENRHKLLWMCAFPLHRIRGVTWSAWIKLLQSLHYTPTDGWSSLSLVGNELNGFSTRSAPMAPGERCGCVAGRWTTRLVTGRVQLVSFDVFRHPFATPYRDELRQHSRSTRAGRGFRVKVRVLAARF